VELLRSAVHQRLDPLYGADAQLARFVGSTAEEAFDCIERLLRLSTPS
jgi:hypothetical protein